MKKLGLLLMAALSWQVFAAEQVIKPNSSANSCGVCDIFRPPAAVVITCERKSAHLAKPSVVLTQGWNVAWSAAGNWSITFTHSPCTDTAIDQGHSTCVIKDDVRSGTYVYRVHLDGCRRDGKGTIKVVKPDKPANTSY
jgi:hypothetical protein